MKFGLERRRSKRREKQKQKRKALRRENKQPQSFSLDATPKSFDIPPELSAFFSSKSLVSVCFGEEDEHGNPIEYDMMALSAEEFNAKLENMGQRR
jgi:hypothetical protein